MLTRKIASAIAFAEVCQRGKGEETRAQLQLLISALHDVHRLAFQMEIAVALTPGASPPMPPRWPENVTPFRVRP